MQMWRHGRPCIATAFLVAVIIEWRGPHRFHNFMETRWEERIVDEVQISARVQQT